MSFSPSPKFLNLGGRPPKFLNLGDGKIFFVPQTVDQVYATGCSALFVAPAAPFSAAWHRTALPKTGSGINNTLFTYAPYFGIHVGGTTPTYLDGGSFLIVIIA